MCTVLFIPDTNKMFFASLRDESPLRPTAITPQLIKKDNLTILSPQDTLAGGTSPAASMITKTSSSY